MEDIIKNAYLESLFKKRKGDKIEEVERIKNTILNAKKIVVSTNNQKKFNVIKSIMEKICKADIKMIDINTELADLTRMPAVYKGLIAVDTEDADIYISRGRLGVPGSGAMLVILDKKGRILSASLSVSSALDKRNIEEKVREELITALRRVGVNIK